MKARWTFFLLMALTCLSQVEAIATQEHLSLQQKRDYRVVLLQKVSETFLDEFMKSKHPDTAIFCKIELE